MQIRSENWAEGRRAITNGTINLRDEVLKAFLQPEMIQWLKIKLLCFRLKFHEAMRN